MAKFIKFIGNYIEIANRLGCPKSFYLPQASLKEYQQQIEQDLSRTPYVSYVYPVEQIKEKLRDTEQLKEKPQSYSQGNFDAEFFKVAITISARWLLGYPRAGSEGTVKSYFDTLRFAYIDDDGKLCGFNVLFIRDDPKEGDQPILEKERKRLFAITIIKNTNHSPEDREVVYFSDPALLKEQNGTEIEGENLFTEVEKHTNSKALNQLLRNLFQNSTVSLDYFHELKARISANRNIDNWETRKVQIEAYIQFAKENNLPQKYLKTIETIEHAMAQDINFFSVPSFKNNLALLHDKIEEAIDSEFKEKSELKVKNKLFFLAIHLELQADLIEKNEEDLHLYIQYTKDAKKIRELIQNPSSKEAKTYASKGLDELLKEVITKAKKIDQLLGLTKSYENDTVGNKRFSELRNKLKRRSTKDNFDEKFNLEETRKKMDDFLAEQKREREALSKRLEPQLVELQNFIEGVKTQTPPYLQKLLEVKLQALKIIQQNPSADDVEKYKDPSIEALIDIFLDSLLVEEFDAFRSPSNYLLTTPREPDLSNDTSNLFHAKLLEKINNFISQKNNKDKERIELFYQHLERLQRIINTVAIDQLFKGDLTKKITEFLENRQNPSSDILKKYATKSFTDLVEQLCDELTEEQKLIIEKTTLITNDSVPENKWELSKNRNTIMIALLAILLFLFLMAISLLFVVGIASVIITASLKFYSEHEESQQKIQADLFAEEQFMQGIKEDNKVEEMKLELSYNFARSAELVKDKIIEEERMASQQANSPFEGQGETNESISQARPHLAEDKTASNPERFFKKPAEKPSEERKDLKAELPVNDDKLIGEESLEFK